LESFKVAIAANCWYVLIRTVAKDQLPMSMAYNRSTVALHITWKPVPTVVETVLRQIEAALVAKCPDVRPHWGKVFYMQPTQYLQSYGKLNEWRSV
jgi:alditol oxidase